MPSNQPPNESFALDTIHQLNAFANGARVVRIQGEPLHAMRAYTENQLAARDTQPTTPEISFLVGLRRKSQDKVHRWLLTNLAKDFEVGSSLPKQLEFLKKPMLVGVGIFNSFMLDLSGTTLGDREQIAALDRDLVTHLQSRGYLDVNPALSVGRAGQNSMAFYLPGRDSSVRIGAMPSGAIPEVLIDAEDSDTFSPGLSRVFTLLHEVSHSQISDMHNIFQPSPGQVSPRAADLLNKSHFLERYTGVLPFNVHVHRVMSECFADAYAAIMLLESSNHDPRVVVGLQQISDKRKKERIELEISKMKDFEKPDTGIFSGHFTATSYPTDFALEQLMKNREQWKGLKPTEARQMALTIASDAVMEWANPERKIEGYPVGALNRLVLSRFLVVDDLYSSTLVLRHILGGDITAEINDIRKQPGGSYFEEKLEDLKVVTEDLLPKNFPKDQDARFELYRKGVDLGLTLEDIFNLSCAQSILATEDPNAELDWKQGKMDLRQGLAKELADPALLVLNERGGNFGRLASDFSDNLDIDQVMLERRKQDAGIARPDEPVQQNVACAVAAACAGQGFGTLKDRRTAQLGLPTNPPENKTVRPGFGRQ